MAEFRYSYTLPGSLLMADIQNGAVLVPTKFVIGTGYMGTGKQPADISDVITPLKEFDVTKKMRMPDGYCIFGFVMTNEDIEEAFYLREIALYAKAEYRDAEGNVTSTVPEVCLIYGNSGSTADLYPAYSTSTVVERSMEISSYIGAAAQVDLTIASGIYATKEELITAAYAKNMLHNAYFVGGGTAGKFPVNRQGLQNYTGGISVDRWSIDHNLSVAVAADGLALTGNGNGALLQRPIDGIEVGKKYTFSVLVAELTGTCYFTTYDGAQVALQNGLNTITFTAVANSFRGMYAAHNLNGTMKLIAAKLERGENQTLARLAVDGTWIINELPSYAEEYAKCVQYSLKDGSYIGLGANAVNALSLGIDRIQIPANSDLNNYIAVGNYCCITTIWAETIGNCPSTVAFLLNVEAATGENLVADPTEHTYIRQHIRDLHNKEFYRMITTNATGVVTYGDWVKIYTSAERPTPEEIGAVVASYADIHNLTNMGLNGCNIDTQFLFNYVASISEAGYGTRPKDNWFNVLNIVGGHFVTQFAISCIANLDSDRPVSIYVRERYVANDQNWSAWSKVFTTTDPPTVNDIAGLSTAVIAGTVE